MLLKSGDADRGLARAAVKNVDLIVIDKDAGVAHLHSLSVAVPTLRVGVSIRTLPYLLGVNKMCGSVKTQSSQL